MSVENLREYARRCATDAELREKAAAIGLENMEEQMRLAESLGLEWSESDMVALRKEELDAGDDLADLSEEDLEKIAGGVNTDFVEGLVKWFK